MYDLYSPAPELEFIRTVSSGRNLVAPSGVTFTDASAVPLATLNENGVYPVEDPGKPDATWQKIVGKTRSIVGGKSVIAYTVEPIELTQAKAKLKSEVKANRDAAIFGGYAWERAPGVVHILDTDNVSLSRIDQTYTMAKDEIIPPEGRVWRMKDNTNVQLTRSELIAMGAAVSVYVGTQYDTQATKEAEIDALTDIAACQAYDPAAGFPTPPVISG